MIDTRTRGLTALLLDRIAGWREALLDEMRRRDAAGRSVAELQALTERELADLGIARCDIRRVARESVYGR